MKNNKVKKIIIGEKLLEEGWFSEEKEAKVWIMEQKVLVNDILITSFFEKVPESGKIRIKEYYKTKYVNKGGLKLEGALKDFEIDVKDYIALDCGASTGGFSDCLLQSGAKLVYSVDVGYGQLAGKLLNDKRIINLERTNLADLKLLDLNPIPEIISLDLSYLSLKKALPLCRNILGDKGEVVCLVKPIYEVDSNSIRRNGNINDYDVIQNILLDLCRYFQENDYYIRGVTNSPVTGNKGTLEYFLYITWGEKRIYDSFDYCKAINEALEKSFKLINFNKMGKI